MLFRSQNEDVTTALNVAMAMIDVGAEDTQQQLTAIKLLGVSDYPESRNRLNQIGRASCRERV